MTLTTNAGGAPMLALDRRETPVRLTPHSDRKPERPVDRRHLAAREPAEFRFSRAMALWVPGETVTCPHSHELSEAAVFLPAGLYQCRSRDHVGKHLRGGAYCGVRLWVWQQPEGGTITVWIEESEWETIDAQRMTVAETRTYLGLCWPRKAA